MKYKRKVSIILTIISIIVFFLVMIHFSSKGYIFLSKEDKASYILNKNYEELSTVTKFLEKSEHDYIYIYSSDGSMYVGYTINIEDKEIIHALKKLFNSGYKSIEKVENTICFLRWTRLMDAGSGLAYSVNKTDEPRMHNITKLVPLMERGWYYYEEDYEMETQGTDRKTGDET